MKHFCLKGLNFSLLVLITLTSLFSCTLEANAARTATEAEQRSRVASMIDEQIDQIMSDAVARELGEDELAELYELRNAAEGLDGRAIVSRMLAEENGEEYLDFTYTAITSRDVDEILDSARPLIGEAEYNDLHSQAEDIQARSLAYFEANARAMSTAQQKQFYKELQALVVKSVVLLTAAIVYAVIPNVVVWGKVSAACVAAVAAGVVAAGIMTVIGYKRYGGEEFDFPTWLKSVCDDSYAEWAIAASAIATAKAAGKSPLITSLIIVALAAYQVFSEAQDMYKLAVK